KVETDLGDFGRCVAVSGITSLGSHCDQFRYVRSKVAQCDGEIPSEVVVVEDNACCTPSLQDPGVQQLLMVAMARIRDKDRGPAGKSNLRDSHRTRASDNEICSIKGWSNIIYKRNNSSLAPEIPVTVRHQRHVSLSCLMNDCEIYNKVSPDFESIQ